MRAVIDTNVFVSGVFFAGPPYAILDAWRNGRLALIVSPAILEEYRRVAHELADQFPMVDPVPALELIAINAHLVEAPDLPCQVCTDADDDKFLACAIASGARVIASGDKGQFFSTPYQSVTTEKRPPVGSHRSQEIGSCKRYTIRLFCVENQKGYPYELHSKARRHRNPAVH